MKKIGSFFNFLARKGLEPDLSDVDGLPLSQPVDVMRDQYGIPHIFAENETDLGSVLGFLHAQDRLWQMESIRRFSSGTLAEIVGREALALDHFSPWPACLICRHEHLNQWTSPGEPWAGPTWKASTLISLLPAAISPWSSGP